MTRTAHRLARLTMAGSVALLTAMPALSATRSDQPVQGWSAMRDVPATALLERAPALPTTDMATGDQPYCADNAEISATLRGDFDEAPVDATRHPGTQLWGSDRMGTWTLVTPRDDQTSCIIASGIGFDADRDVSIYYESAGLL